MVEHQQLSGPFSLLVARTIKSLHPMNHIHSQLNDRGSFKQVLRALGLGLALLALVPFCSNAQTSVNASGGSATIGGELFAYSIGEMVLVGSSNSGQVLVTQSELQADAGMSVSLPEETIAEGRLVVYPNPVDNILYLQPEMEQGGELSMRLFDVNGRLILDGDVRLGSGNERQEIDMASLTEGSYFLRTAMRQGDQTYNKLFKIIKSNGRE